MRIFSTFTGIGGFEVGIRNAYRSANRAGEEAAPGEHEETRRGLFGSQGQSSGTEERQAGERASDVFDERPLRSDVPPAPRSERPRTGSEEALADREHERLGAQQFTCVGYSEIDKYAISVFEKHFGGRCEDCNRKYTKEFGENDRAKSGAGVGDGAERGSCAYGDERCAGESGIFNYGDITKINAKELPDFDCLVGGFPCQAFSIAGKRRGFDDTRGTLFFDLARILREKQPRYFVFENVKGLLSHDQGNTFRTIITTIDELGYDCQWQVLNSKDFGVPQNRERVYIVGHLRGTPRPEVFPLAGTDTADTFIRTIRTGGAASYTGKYARDIIRIGNVNPSGRGMNGNVISSEGLSSTLSTNKGEGLKVAVSGVKIRRLTPLECERLQGFPDNWTAEGIDGPISDTQRYKMCGNAVTTNVVQAVFERILA